MTFLDWTNKNIDDVPKQVQEYAQNAYSGTTYCSIIGKHYGLYEMIFGVQKNRRGTRIQKLIMLRENGESYVRNMYSNDYGMACGIYSYGYDGKEKRFKYGGLLPYEPTMSEMRDWVKTERIDRRILNLEEVPELDESLKYWNYKPYVEPMEYVRIYKAFPKQAEMLMRFDYWRMITMHNCKILSENPRFHRYLERHYETLRRKPFQTVFNSWKRNPEGSVDDYERSLVYRIECGKQVAFDNRRVYDKAMRYTTQERLAQWLKENKISNASYGDYLVACDWLKLDFSDTKVLFPRNFQEVHDLYTKQYGDYQAEQKKAEIARQNTKMKRTAKKFAFLSINQGGYIVKVAQSPLELIDEGSALHHCVGRMGYDKKQANGESVICFIRKVDEPDTPFVTAEVKVTPTQLKVVQRYADKNKPTPELQEWSDNWMEYANRRYKRAV